MVNMKELFAYDFISDQHSELVPVTDAQLGKWGLDEGDLLFGRRSLTLAGAGKVSIVKHPTHRAVFESSMIRARLDPRLGCPDFYFYLFRSKPGREIMEAIVEQVAVAGIRSSDLARLRVPVPPLDEQRRIAAVLGAFDDLIETNRSLAVALEEEARLAWRDLLGRETSDTTVLADVATVILGGTPSRNTPEFWGGDIPWLNSGMANDFRVIEGSEGITQQGYDRSSTKMVPAGATLIAITGATLGQVTRTEIEACGNQSLVGVYSKNDPALSDHLYLSISDDVEQLVRHATGGAQQHINKGNVEQMQIQALGPGARIEMENKVSPLLASIGPLLMEGRDLTRARDGLLPLLISGRIRVADLEGVA
jgi:type I restriction enzyme, S subunit